MAVVSVPKDLDRVKKSLECFGRSADCYVYCVMLCYCHE